jgi:mannose-6-phosphate isomerase-like protein (cupin superfamily)
MFAFIFASLGSSGLLAAGDTNSTVVPGETYVSAHELASKAAQMASGVGYQIPSSAGYTVLMIERAKTGDAEVHMQMNDTIIIEKGSGTFWVGGQITGNHEIRPTEWRGGEMTGARTYNVSVGDLLLVPAGVPHKAIVTVGPFAYLTIKTPRQSPTSP